MAKVFKFINNVLFNKCPRCKKGKVWCVSALPAFWVKEPMHTYCPNCNLKFERELGFWQGAMFISYGISIGIFVLCWILSEMFIPYEAPMLYTVLLVTIVALMLSPINWRWSRLIWLNFWTNEDSN